MSRDVTVVDAYWSAAVSDEDVYVAGLSGDTVIEILGWLAAYVVLAVVADRFGTRMFFRLLAKKYRRWGYTVTLKQGIFMNELHAHKHGKCSIYMKVGRVPWRR